MPTEPAPLDLPRQIALLRQANAMARDARARGHHPFGALLVAPDGQTVLLSQGNVDGVNHAEAVLARVAAHRYSREQLWACTLVTTFEPCAMCAGTQYWAHIGRLLYGASEQRLRELTGDDPANPTLDLPCRHVFAAGRKPVQVIGPVPELDAELAEPHLGFWHPAS